LAIAALVALAGAIVAADPAERFERFKRAPGTPTGGEAGFTESHLLSSGGSGRWQFWSTAIDEYQTRPLVGRGAGSYEAWWAENGSLDYFIRDAHSLYVETLGELGLIGLGLIVAVFGAGLVSAAGRLRRRSVGARGLTAALAAAFAAFAVGAAIDWAWELTVIGVVAMLCLGLLCGPATARGERSEEGAHEQTAEFPAVRARRRRIAIAARVTFCAASLAVVVALAIPLLAQNQLRASQEAAASGDTHAALESALAARGLQGWAASPHLQIALVEEQTGDLGAARTAIAEAIERDGSDWRQWLVAARIEAKSGNRAAARERLRQARRLNPRSPLLQ
jgi:O-antigen ligase